MQIDTKQVKTLIYQISNVYPILPIVINPEVEPVQFMQVKAKPQYFQSTTLDSNGCVIGERLDVGRAIAIERIGQPLPCFTEFYIGESDDHLDAVIEHYDGAWGMSYADAINQANVY